ncbi:putative AP-1-like transcription factor [Calycina marina]|uniref:Putative transcription factor kapC n=1 Tax=Calycina marina TaxID=1763456 RepID=A0A9P7Z270_9HELO|nr:putative AP-1-like transcription factor [Calycina marina]
MSTGYGDSGQDSAYLMASDINAVYGGTSSESSANSPMKYNGYDISYSATGYLPYSPYPLQYAPAPITMIPVELDIESIYEGHDRRRRKNAGSEKAVAPHVHSVSISTPPPESQNNISQRRRAQNRASQRAFRDRKEKHMRELEQRLNELEGRHTDLSYSYKLLQHEYSSVKQELDRLRKGEADQFPASNANNYSSSRGRDSSKVEILDPLLFDVSAFCFDENDKEIQK